jgi:hypothetical protein
VSLRLAAAATLTLLGAPGACHRKEPPVTTQSTNAPTLADLSREVRVSFPSSARLIWVGRESGIDDLVSFKVELDPVDLPAFLAASPVPRDAFNPGEGGLLGSDTGPWTPNQAARLRTGQVIREHQRALNIGIDDGKPGVVVLYIVSHST